MKTQECKSKHEIIFSCSCVLKVMYIVAFAVLAGVIVVARVSIEIKAIAVLLGLFGVAVAWRQLRWLENIKALIISNEGMCIEKKVGDPEDVSIVGGVFVSPLVATFKCVPASNVSVLNAFQKFWAVSVVVFRDSVSESDHHILRTYLNTGQLLKQNEAP